MYLTTIGNRDEYLGNDHIVIGNGSQLPITSLW